MQQRMGGLLLSHDSGVRATEPLVIERSASGNEVVSTNTYVLRLRSSISTSR